MKVNLPVTDVESVLPDNELIDPRTDSWRAHYRGQRRPRKISKFHARKWSTVTIRCDT